MVGVVSVYMPLSPYGDSASSFNMLHALAGLCVAHAEESWKKEFDEICSKTEVSTTLTKEELRELIARGDRLRAVIATLDESARKVYLKRLQMCLDLFAYAVDMKEKN
jgi:predicted secreted protein